MGKLHEAWKEKRRLISEAHQKQLAKQTAVNEQAIRNFQEHPILDELAEVGLHLELLGCDAHHIFFKLPGHIRWVNDDGSITILEEQGQTDTIDNLIEQIHHYIEHAPQYTDFVDRDKLNISSKD